MSEIKIVSEIKNFPNHIITTDGEVFNIKRKSKEPLKPFKQRDGYYYIIITHKGYSKHMPVHRLLGTYFIDNPLNLPFIDHKDGCKTNNELSNLRWCTKSQNQMNRKPNKNGSSQYKGLTWDKGVKKWSVRIMLDNKAIPIGRFENEREGAKAYNEKALQLFGEFALLNTFE